MTCFNRDTIQFGTNEAELSISRTARGISIHRSDECENASDSIRINRESHSNEIDESELQQERHDDPRMSIFRGIIVDSSNEDENAQIQFESIVNLIQMKSMKVICILKNVIIQEFQHSGECQSIEVTKMKMLPIQLESSALMIRI
jgi:hypothetical protein